MSYPTSIRDRQIHHLEVAFFRETALDDLLGPLLDEVAEIDWTGHSCD